MDALRRGELGCPKTWRCCEGRGMYSSILLGCLIYRLFIAAILQEPGSCRTCSIAQDFIWRDLAGLCSILQHSLLGCRLDICQHIMQDYTPRL
jgi:hypothetical protein